MPVNPPKPEEKQTTGTTSVAGFDAFKAVGGAASAILFMGAATMTLDIASALNSSPWTAESFGGDADKAKSCREYVYWSLGFAGFFGILAAIVAHSWLPLVGVALAGIFMYWIYNRALQRAAEKGNDGWS